MNYWTQYCWKSTWVRVWTATLLWIKGSKAKWSQICFRWSESSLWTKETSSRAEGSWRCTITSLLINKWQLDRTCKPNGQKLLQSNIDKPGTLTWMYKLTKKIPLTANSAQKKKLFSKKRMKNLNGLDNSKGYFRANNRWHIDHFSNKNRNSTTS